ncbi:MAG: arylsulfatase [Planctomycetes bacterium]|nr:arylsulfatase [Planctomycetota bacterium]
MGDTVRMRPGSMLLCLVGLAACHTVSPDPPRPPNFVVILADDLGIGDVHAFNPLSKIPTPNLDGLAADGMRFLDAHTPSSVCTPTRYGLLTGRYCWRSRLKSGVLDGYGARLIERGRATLADVLAGAGYHTAVVGKWHLGLGWPRTASGTIDFTRPVDDAPNRLGFASSFVIPASLDFPPYVFLRDGRVTDPHIVEQPAQRFPAFLRRGPRARDLVMEDVLDRLVEQAVHTLRSRSLDRPFFLYLALSAPHKPVLPHPRFRGKSGLGPYGDFVCAVDDAVGRVLRALEHAGLHQHTLVLFTSDNGSFMRRFDDARQDHLDDPHVQGFRAARHRANGPYRGTKADIWEAGHRVPTVVRWPSRIVPNSRCTTTVCLTDVFATFAELAGIETPADAAEDSFSFAPQLLGQLPRAARPPVVHHSVNGTFAIRAGRYKLVASNGSGGREQPRGTPFGRPFALFDLENDPGESHDLAAARPAVVAELETMLARLRERGRSVAPRVR